jgi:hypothetical protein
MPRPNRSRGTCGELPARLHPVAIAVCDVTGAGTIATIACEVAGFVVPATFTARYPKIVQARYAS